MMIMMLDTILLMGSSLFLAFVGGWYFGKAIFSNDYDDDDKDGGRMVYYKK